MQSVSVAPFTPSVRWNSDAFVDGRAELTSTLYCYSCHRIPPSWWLSGLAASTVLCAAVLVPMFDLRLYEPFVAVAVALLVAVLAVRALVCANTLSAGCG